MKPGIRMIRETILHYRIIEEIGRGGMGVVYKAEDTKLKREVAIKFLPHHAADGEEERKRFMIEAQAAAALNHPNIATIYAIEEVDDKMFIVMEYIDGQELKQKIDAGPLPLDEVLEIAGHIAEGLKVAHEKGVVHRDIKSSNVMLTATGQVKIMDFGLARIGEGAQLTKSGTTRGTAAYMSPEQVSGKEVDRRTDIWSFGVVLYEMLTWQLPFNGAFEQAVFYSILNEEPKPVTELRSEIPKVLEDIICIALSKEPADRYSDLDELIADLHGCMMSLKPGMQAIEIPTRTHRRSMSPLIIAGFIFLLLAVISIGVYFQFLSRGEKIEEHAEIALPKWEHKVAVLPLRDISPNKDQEYFCDGMTEAIIGRLTSIKQLKVISFSSVLRYKNIVPDIKQIGKNLDVKAILEGAIQKEKNKIRVNVQLINVSDESLLWHRRYENKQGSVFDIQDNISQAIVNVLEIKLLNKEEKVLKKRYTRSAEAYNLYMLGLFNLRKSGSLSRSIDYFKKALERDPNYALAYEGLASTYRIMAWLKSTTYENPNKDLNEIRKLYSDAKKFVQRALELDETLAEAHTTLGKIRMYYEWNFKGAKRAFLRAIELNPGYARAHSSYSIISRATGDWKNAIVEAHRARELDPLYYSVYNELGLTYFESGDYDRAIEQFKISNEMVPESNENHIYIGMAYLEKSMYKEALEELELERQIPFYARFVKMFVYARMGEKEKLRKFVEKEKKRGILTSPFMIAVSYAELGETDQMFTWLEKAYKLRDPPLVIINRVPYFNNYRKDPRFKTLLKKMGLD
jgi:serine/threonine protein kinase